MARPSADMSRIETGSVFRRNDGTWIAKWRKQGERAWKQHRCADATDEASARAELVADVSSVEAPVLFATFGAWFEASYLPSLPVADSTRALYAQHWRCRCQSLARVPWDELSAARLERWVMELRQARPLARVRRGAPVTGKTRPGVLSPHYIRAIVDLVSSGCRHAHALGLLAVNPAPAVRRALPRAAGISQKPRALNEAELVRLSSSAKVPRVARVLYLVSALEMLRPGEARALRWGDLDLDGASVTVRASSRTRRAEGPPKGRVARTVPLHPAALAELVAWRAAWLESYGQRAQAADFVFASSRDRGRQAPDPIGFSRHCVRAGVPSVTRHALRHTGASLYRSAGVAIDDLRVMLGHKGGVTEHYARPSLGHLAQEMGKFRWPGCAARRELDPISTAGVEITPMPHSTTQDGAARGSTDSVAKSATLPAETAAAAEISTPSTSAAASGEVRPAARRTLRLVRFSGGRDGEKRAERHAVEIDLHPGQDSLAVHRVGLLLSDAARNRHGVEVQLVVREEPSAPPLAFSLEQAREAVLGAAFQWHAAERTELDWQEIDRRCSALEDAIERLRALQVLAASAEEGGAR